MKFIASASVGPVVAHLPIVLLALVLLGGCGQSDEITTYTVKKLKQNPRTTTTVVPPVMPRDGATPSDDGPADRDRMLAAIVPHGEVSWFFKMTGPRDAVAEQMDNFLALIKSIKFADKEAAPEWTLPEGWSEGKKANSFAHATLQVKSGDDVLQATVTPAGGDVLMNINRWCGQMGLPAKTLADLTAEDQPKNSEVRTFEVAGSQVTLVNLVGKMSGGGPMSKPRPPAVSKTPQKPGQPTWTVPDGWRESKGSSISLAAFAVVEGDKSVETTVTPAGGDVLTNINRWRGQLGLPDWSAEELVQQSKSVSVDGSPGTLVALVGKDSKTGQPSGLNGAIVQVGQKSWFFKMTGDPELAKREQSNFEAFVKSVKF